jgi:hypothetical protein
MAECAACGLPLPAAAAYCRHCGAGVREAGGLRTYAQPTDTDLAPPDPPPAPRGRRRTGLAVLALLLVAGTVAAGLVATHRLTREPAGGPAAVPGSAAPIGGTATVTPSATPTVPAGTLAVQLAESLRDDPYAANVVALFRRYFGSINERDYDGWLGTLSRDRKPDTREKYLDEYSTTADDEVRIVGITPGEDGVLSVAVSFRSRQDPAYAPVDQPVDCLRWQISYPLVFEDGVLKIALVGPVNRTYRPCTDG